MRKLKRRYRFGGVAIIILLLIFFFRIFLLPEQFKLNCRKYPIVGIDISKNNGNIEWKKISNQRISFVYIKVSEGKNLIDNSYLKNYKAAKELGLKVGAYHFFKYNRDGAEQANTFISKTKTLKFDLPPALDIEDHYNFTNRNKPNLVIKEIRKFIKVVENKTKRKVIIYTNQHEYSKYIKDNFKNNPIWISSLDEEPDIDRECGFWQYTHRGKLEGIKGWVDFNVFNGSVEEWQKFLNSQ